MYLQDPRVDNHGLATLEFSFTNYTFKRERRGMCILVCVWTVNKEFVYIDTVGTITHSHNTSAETTKNSVDLYNTLKNNKWQK